MAIVYADDLSLNWLNVFVNSLVNGLQIFVNIYSRNGSNGL